MTGIPLLWHQTNMSEDDRAKCLHDMMTFGQCAYEMRGDGQAVYVPMESYRNDSNDEA